MAIASNIGELIGNTPILRLRRYEAALGCCGKLFAKLAPRTGWPDVCWMERRKKAC